MSFDPNRPANPEPFTPAAPEASAVPTNPVVATTPVMAATPLPARKTSSGGRWLNLVLALAAAVAVGGVAFAVGRGTAPVSAATGNGRGNFGGGPGGSFAPGASGQPGLGRGGFGGGFGGGVTLSGTVVSVTADTMAIKTTAGQTIELSLGASTTYHTQAAASATDVQAGKTVQVQLDGVLGRPSASAATSGPIGTAGSVTVVP